MRTISVGLLGLGNVGSGVVKLLADNAEAIRQRLGGASAVAIRRIAVREADKPRLVDVAPTLITTDVRAVLDDPEIEIVVELIGGEEPARTYVLDAIARGKHIVTANKALLAAHGDELFAPPAERGVDVYYEASVGGGVPIIRALREGLASDRVDELVAIVNGTSNFLLTTMTEEGRPLRRGARRRRRTRATPRPIRRSTSTAGTRRTSCACWCRCASARASASSRCWSRACAASSPSTSATPSASAT